MNKKDYILVYDSGIGGLTTLSKIINICPNQNYIYFADNKNCPYGNKCNIQLQQIIINNINNLINKYNITHIVLACNTATTSSINILRQTFNIPIIGTEPNVKTPTLQGYKNVLLLATPTTIKADKLLNLENTLKYQPQNKGIKNLAKYIEDYMLTQDKTKLSKIKTILANALKNTPKTTAIVLGCTHYIYIKEIIEEKGYKCFDGNTGVANRLKYLIKENSLKTKGKTQIITNDPLTTYKYRKLLNKMLNKEKTSNINIFK